MPHHPRPPSLGTGLRVPGPVEWGWWRGAGGGGGGRRRQWLCALAGDRQTRARRWCRVQHLRRALHGQRAHATRLSTPTAPLFVHATVAKCHLLRPWLWAYDALHTDDLQPHGPRPGRCAGVPDERACRPPPPEPSRGVDRKGAGGLRFLPNGHNPLSAHDSRPCAGQQPRRHAKEKSHGSPPDEAQCESRERKRRVRGTRMSRTPQAGGPLRGVKGK